MFTLFCFYVLRRLYIFICMAVFNVMLGRKSFVHLVPLASVCLFCHAKVLNHS